MNKHITVTALMGKLQGREFIFPDRSTIQVGRAPDCAISVPDHLHLISRRHCEIRINLPSIYVRDLGSLNGTCVNGRLIGRRPQGNTTQEAREASQQWKELEDGDEVMLGTTVLRVNVLEEANEMLDDSLTSNANPHLYGSTVATPV